MSELEADYVIVGAGSAGCVLANRLSEDAGTQVLLLEAGGKDKKIDIHVPVASPRLHKSDVDWQLWTEPQPACDGRKIYVPRGRVLGGCSATNTMIYIRGQAEDYDGWAARGLPGWGWEDIKPYFLKSEDYYGGAGPHHGAGGELRVEKADARTDNPLWEAFVEAGVAAGWPRNDDFNGDSQEGFGIFDVTVKRGVRWSTARAFLRPALKRPNLRVEVHARAERVLVEGGRAVGVRFRQGDRVVTAKARREVLVSAGAIHSPQLLMLSGIGPGEHLREHGVEVVRDLPGVGDELHDHSIATLSWLCPKKVSVNTAESVLNALKWLLFKRGPYAAVVPAAGAFITAHPDSDRPDIEVHFAAGWAHDIHDYPARPMEDGFTIAPVLLRPLGRGSLRLKSGRLEDPPAIDPGLLAHERDVETLVHAVEKLRPLVEQPSFEGLVGGRVIPKDDLRDRDAIEAWLRSNVGTTYHPVSTCRMGGDDDPGAVLDAELRVRGLEGLRVVDASVMPEVVSGNTNAPVIAIAEKAADMIVRS